MQPRSIQERAVSAKKEIKSGLDSLDLSPRSLESDPFHNPIAYYGDKLREKFSVETKKLFNELQDSVKLVISPENMDILTKYYNERKLNKDSLGELYKQISFEDFILRLYNKRYKQVYLDGRVIVPRDDKPFKYQNFFAGLAHRGRQILSDISHSDQNGNGAFVEYLTLEELVLSPLVLPQVCSLVIGTGNRSHENVWDVVEEFSASCDVVSLSYPAAAEFRDGYTAHYDLLFITVPYHGYAAEQLKRINEIKNNAALLHAATAIYGNQLPSMKNYEKNPDEYLQITKRVKSSDNLLLVNPLKSYKPVPGYVLLNDPSNPLLLFVDGKQQTLWLDIEKVMMPNKAAQESEQNLKAYLLEATNKGITSEVQKKEIQKALKKYHGTPAANHACVVTHLLLKKAYLNRTKNMLKAMLLAADAEMASLGLGQTYQLKGLGLGAFSFLGEDNQLALEKLYIEALKAVLLNNPLKHIKIINLINLPSGREREEGQVALDSVIGEVKIFLSTMDPTSKAREATIGEIGGTQFCGDSGSLVGNEGNQGAPRNSSDDPAQQYALFNPVIFNPLYNRNLRQKHCIYICANQQLERQYEIDTLSALTTEDKREKDLRLEAKDVIDDFNQIFSQPMDEAVFKSKAVNFINRLKNNADLLRLFNEIKNKNHFCNSATLFGSKIRTSSNPNPDTWLVMVHIMQARFILNVLSIENINEIPGEAKLILEDETSNEFINCQPTTKWFSRSTEIKTAMKDLQKCQTFDEILKKSTATWLNFENILKKNLHQTQRDFDNYQLSSSSRCPVSNA